jgi:hypothetical protein
MFLAKAPCRIIRTNGVDRFAAQGCSGSTVSSLICDALEPSKA